MATLPAATTSLTEVTLELGRLWDGLVVRAEALQDEDWSLPTQDRDMDVRDLVVHLATTGAARASPRGTAGLLRELRETRDQARSRLVSLASTAEAAAGLEGNRDRRLLGAHCLDLVVHCHDLAAAVGERLDLVDSPAAAEACRYVLPMAERLLARRAGNGLAAAPRLEVGRSVTGGPGTPWPGQEEAVVTATPAALVLLLSGRSDPDEWRRRGALTWSGEAAESFVRRVRLFGDPDGF